MSIDAVNVTRSGIVTRRDPGVGMLTYSPYSGSCFISPEAMADGLAAWLECSTTEPPTEAHALALGPGWAIPKGEGQYPVPHLLPDALSWPYVYIRQPIAINWMITGACPLSCEYCYAADLMRGGTCGLAPEGMRSVAEAIVSLDPVLVVLSGGEPLSSPDLSEALAALEGRTGLVLDTSGIGLTDEHLRLFRRHRVFVRVSLDSERRDTNDRVRKGVHRTKSQNEGGSNHGALAAICRLLDAGLDVGVQSVAMRTNRNGFESMGDKLYRLGVSTWRILIMIRTVSNAAVYSRLLGDQRGVDRFYRHILTRVMRKHSTDWNRKMAVQVVPGSAPDSVVLVGPDGIFYTESNVPLAGKVVIDEASPHAPSLECIREKVNMHAHTDRYLNIPRDGHGQVSGGKGG